MSISNYSKKGMCTKNAIDTKSNCNNCIDFSLSFQGKSSCLKELDKMKSRYHFNPMGEFMHENFEDVEVDEMFDEFKKLHRKSYQDPAEHEQRKHIFRHNVR